MTITVTGLRNFTMPEEIEASQIGIDGYHLMRGRRSSGISENMYEVRKMEHWKIDRIGAALIAPFSIAPML